MLANAVDEYVIGVGGMAGVGGDEVEDEREPNPLQLARRDAADVVAVGDTTESVLRSLSLRCKRSGLVDKGNDGVDCSGVMF